MADMNKEAFRQQGFTEEEIEEIDKAQVILLDENEEKIIGWGSQIDYYAGTMKMRKQV